MTVKYSYLLKEVETNIELAAELRQYLGAYVLFYTGPFQLYLSITQAHLSGFELPIYIGKAVPKGDRTGVKAETLYSGK